MIKFERFHFLMAVFIICLSATPVFKAHCLSHNDKTVKLYHVDMSQKNNTAAISLKGAKNEFISILFQVERADLKSLEIAVDDKNQDISWRFYQVVPAPRGSADYDVLVPLELGLDNTVKSLRIWGTAKIEENAREGKRETTIVLKDAHGDYRQTLNLHIWNFSLPTDLPIAVMAGLFHRPEWFQRYHVTTPEQFDAFIKKYLAVMREYKINALGQFYPLPVEKVISNGSLKHYSRFTDILKYSLETLGYRYFFIPVLLGAKTIGQPDSNFLANAKTYYRIMNDFLQPQGWENRGIVYLWDEPDAKEYPLVRKSYAALKEMAPNLQTMMAVLEYGESILELPEVLDILVIYAKAFNPEKNQTLKAKGQKIWLYANRLHGQGQPLVNPRAIGWFLYNHEFSGYFFWGVNYWPQDPWTTEAGRHDFWRRGTFLYPHPQTGEPCPSLRLEAVRQGLQDYLYLQKFAEAHRQGRLAPGVYESLHGRIQAVTQDLKNLRVPVTMAEMDDIRHQIGETLNNNANKGP